MDWQHETNRPILIHIKTRGHFGFYCNPDEVYNYVEKLEAENEWLKELIRDADDLINLGVLYRDTPNWLIWRTKCKENGVEL